MNKKYLIIGLAGLILLLGLLTYSLTKNNNIITYSEPMLTTEAKAIYEQRLAEAKQKVSEIKEDTSKEDQFNRYVQLGNDYLNLGFYAEAKTAYLRALDIMPNDAYVWHIYSTTLASMQDFKKSLSAIQKAISLDSGNADFWKWQIALEKDHFAADYTRLNNLYLEALSKTANDINMITVYAQFLEENNQLQAAKEYWQQAIERNPSNQAAYEAEISRLAQKMQAQ